MEQASDKRALDQWESDGGLILELLEKACEVEDAQAGHCVPAASEEPAKKDEQLDGS
jgi:hypothetical protein